MAGGCDQEKPTTEQGEDQNLTTDSTDNSDLHGSKKAQFGTIFRFVNPMPSVFSHGEICFLCKPSSLRKIRHRLQLPMRSSVNLRSKHKVPPVLLVRR